MSTTSDNKDGIELMLAHFNMADMVEIMEKLYLDGESVTGNDSIITMYQNLKDNEECAESLSLSGQETSLLAAVRYGTCQDLLTFANQVSNAAKHLHRCLKQESGIILNRMIAVKHGRYQIDSDVILFPWKLTYRNIGSDFIPRGAFGKVHLAQDQETRKRMACKLVCWFKV